MTYDELPACAQDSLRDYFGQYDYPEDVLKMLRDNRFRYFEMNTDEAKALVMSKLESDFSDFDSYHAWYLSGGQIPDHPATDRWPVLLSSRDDDAFEDGWHRFHCYVRRGDLTIPVVEILSETR